MAAGTRTSSQHLNELRPDVGPLIFPRSAAVVGVSERTAAGIVENVIDKGIPVVAVHPRDTSVGGLACYPTIGAVPSRPELAWMLVGHRRIEAAFDEALAAGVRSFVLPGLGNEAGAEGPAVAERVARRALEAGAGVIGPNCMGVAAPGAASFWIGTVPPTFVGGHVSALVHSGSIGEALLALGPRIGFRCVVSSGGELVRDVADFCAFFAQDPGTQVVGLFLETVRRPAAFARSLELLAEAQKPVVCLKVGRSQGGARAVLAHSGAIVGSDQAFRALLRGYGVIEVADYPELVEVLEVLGRRRRPRGLRLAGVSNSGGEGALLADHAEAAGIPFLPLSDSLTRRLIEAFPNYVAPQNPVDAWAIDDVERVFPGTLQLMAESGEFDVLVAQVDQSQFLGRDEAANALLITGALADAVDGTSIFPAVTSVQTSDPTPEVAALARARDIALLRGSQNGMRALARAAAWTPRHPPGLGDAKAIELADLLRPGAMPEYESGSVLDRYGIRVAPRRRARTPAEAAEAAGQLGFPVVVKRDGPAHESRHGGVILGLGSPEAVADAATSLGGPVLVAAQLPSRPEAFCGMTRDPDHGPVLAVGLGGADVEQIPGAVVCIAPIDFDGARRMVGDAKLIAGSLGPADREALAQVLVALGRLAVDHPEITAVDVNPVVVIDHHAVALDALVVVAGGGGEA
jgi:acetate---CoA ligase (ADP-forming)